MTTSTDPRAPTTPEELLALWGDKIRALGRKWHGYACPFDALLDADDVAQEIAVTAARRLHTFDPARRRFGVWLAFLARSEAQRLRAKALRPIRGERAHGSTFPDGNDVFAHLIDPRAADPTAEPAAEPVEVLVPVCDMGAGVAVAWVRDVRTGERHRVARPALTLVGVRVCVRLVGYAEEEGLWRVALPGGALVWVRVDDRHQSANNPYATSRL